MTEPSKSSEADANKVITHISDALFDLQEDVEWLKGRSVQYYGNPVDTEKLTRGYTAAVQGVREMQVALPPNRVKSTGRAAAFTTKRTSKWYTWVERNFPVF